MEAFEIDLRRIYKMKNGDIVDLHRTWTAEDGATWVEGTFSSIPITSDRIEAMPLRKFLDEVEKDVTPQPYRND